LATPTSALTTPLSFAGNTLGFLLAHARPPPLEPAAMPLTSEIFMPAALTRNTAAPAADLAPLPARRPLRITPAPDVDLPFDDERTSPQLPLGQETLPLPFERVSTPPVLRLVPTGADAAAEPTSRNSTASSHPLLPTRPLVPLPKPDVRVLVQALCEVLSGTRPAVQLTTSVSPSVLAALRSSAGAGPWRSADGGVGPRPAVRSVHVQETSDGVLDVCAVVRRGPRHHALALRMRRRRTRWEATTVQVG
jgi:hypothetical protein